MHQEKTNVMRLLDQRKVSYTPHFYACPDGAVDGRSVAALIGLPPERVFKTLVTRGASKQNYVFCHPRDRRAGSQGRRQGGGGKSPSR